MRVEVSELCYSCRKIPMSNGMTVEEVLNVLYNDNEKYMQCGGDSGVHSALYTTLVEGGGCYECRDLVLKRGKANYWW